MYVCMYIAKARVIQHGSHNPHLAFESFKCGLCKLQCKYKIHVRFQRLNMKIRNVNYLMNNF